MKDKIYPKGTVCIQLFSPEGVLKTEINNLVTNAGLAYIASRIKGDSGPISHMAVGTGTTAQAVTDTTLETETARVALDSTTIVTTNVTDDSVRYTATFGPGVGTGAITEAGLFDVGTAGIVKCRTVFPVVNKSAADSMVLTWTLGFLN